MKIGFQADTGADRKEISADDFAGIKEKVLTEVKQWIPAELLNRMSAQVVFHPLTKALMINIFKTQLDDFL